MEINHKLNRPQYFFNLMIGQTTTIMLAIVSIIYNNSLRSSPIFLFLLALGIGISSGIGLKRGGLLGLLLLSVWITTKQVIGVWSEDKLVLNLIEIILATATFFISGFYHETLKAHFMEYSDDKQKLKLLDLEDTGIGLIKPAIGLLRLKEESDRALRYRRPLSLILILVRPSSGIFWSTDSKRRSVMRAIATALKEITRTMDIPFIVNQEKIALILPNTEINGANKVISNIMGEMSSARIINSDGSSDSLQNYAQLRFGFGVFIGYSREPIDLMAEAEKSIHKNIEANPGNIFQNLFIDWEVVGEPIVSNTVLALGGISMFIDPADHNVPDRALLAVENNS